MKYLFVIFISVLVISCKNDVAEAAQVEEKIVDVVEVSEKNIKIPVLSYNELEPYLNKKNDTTYIINFWATWCKPCIKELPYFEDLRETYSNEKVKVILVSLDFVRLLEKQVIPFVKKRNIKSQVFLLDDPNENEWIPKIDENWSGAIPATIIYNKTNRKFYEHSFTYSALETELKTML